MLQQYPDQEKNIDGYRRVLDALKIMEPKVTEFTILIEFSEPIDDDGEDFVHVCGYNTVKEEGLNDKAIHYSLYYTDWDEWLGMLIEPQSLYKFGEYAVLVHCLYEMTFNGFSQDDITKAQQVLEQASNGESFPIEDLWKELDDLDDE